MRSMTGMGTAQVRRDGMQLRVDIRSVNHRFLDIVFRLPPEFSDAEAALREKIAAAIERGRISVGVDLEGNGQQRGLELVVDEAYVDAYVQTARRLAKKHKLSGEIELDRVLALPEVMRLRKRETPARNLRPLLDEAFDAALAQFQAMRDKEGASLARALQKRLKVIEQERKKIGKHAAEIPREAQRRLRERLAKLGASEAVDPQRLAAEVALLADRANISEELDRLASHVEQFGSCLRTPGPTAKRMGFLLQEMHREVNTTGSKSTHLAITASVVRMKEELESLREQIANLE
jgi:uncharacterized protein (TIGR00255 family)